jgi:uncharacterized membrane protein YkoI
MKLPRTQTALAAVLLLAAAPFALALPSWASGAGTPDGTTAAPGAPARPPNASAPAATASGAAGTAAANTSGPWHGRRAQATGGTQPLSAAMVPKADIHAARSVKVSLTRAIRRVEKHAHGKAIDARFELLHGRPQYMVKTFLRKKDAEWIGHVDARTGRLIGRGRTIGTTHLLPEDQQEITAASSASTSLLEAVTKAEHHEHGKALAAGMSARNGAVTYRTQILKKDGMTQMASINPRSGEVTPYR